MSFRAPVRDLVFSLTEVAGLDRLLQAYPELDRETVEAVLQGAGDLADGVIAPLNREGDLTGARLENGCVVTPPGFRDAYRAFADGGWGSLAAEPEHGGQGLPGAVSLAAYEMLNAANMAFALCPVLTESAVQALTAHGTARQKALFLPRLVSGDWTGTMNLTEPQAGSDLALLRTRADPDGEGGYRITGQKIYITWGDHDCADNILHLVLARLPDAPEGVRGISLFLVPKRHVAEDGALGAANALKVGGLEHKLGIHASPTCVMLFEGARGELIGQPHQGLACMFTMMNAARLNVGAQGVGIAERAYQAALAYAQERRQGRSPWTGQSPAPIMDHPDVRRALAVTRAKIAAGRAICLSTAVAADLARRAASEAEREEARLREELFTPIAKAWCTDLGVEAASMAVQVHGGMGYIEETGVAQHYRDARIAPIYEGTNGIQAIDLIGRKLGMTGEGAGAPGEAVRRLTRDIRATLARLQGPDLTPLARRMESGVAAVERATEWHLDRRGSPDSLAGAAPYLRLLGDVAGGWMLAKGALAEEDPANGDPAQDGRGKGRAARVALARVYAEQVLSGVPGLAEAATAGATDLEALSASALSD